jgi:hypothetical protein
VVEEEYDEDLQAWLLKDVDLFEFSVVTFPANELATVTTVKSLGSRDGAHAASVERHAKALSHELRNYFGVDSDRREALDSDLLTDLRSLLPGEPAAAGDSPAANAEAIKLAYHRGGLDAIEALRQAQRKE